MEIKFKDTTDLAKKVLKINDVEVVAKAIEAYGNIRAAASIEKAWRKATLVYRKLRERKQEKLKNQVLFCMDESAVIPVVEFIEWISSVEAEAKRIGAQSDHAETQDGIDCLIDFMYSKLGEDIRVDKRLLFSRNWERDYKKP